MRSAVEAKDSGLISPKQFRKNTLISKRKQHQKNDQEKRDKKEEISWSQHEGQGQVTNLFLLIPFTTYSPILLQVPIYFYLIWLQTGKTPSWVFYSMFLSICAIVFLDSSQNENISVKILLRLCMILVVNKNFKIAINITSLLRSIWLRSSFVFVLMILFWFSLLTVNIFHICFVLIVLLFITKNNPNTHSQEPSFRHRNWKYLILLFDVFLILRFVYLFLVKDFKVRFGSTFNDVLSIIGIQYSYRSSLDSFNIVPLIVSGVLTIQYWTYTSRIYDMETKSSLPFLP